MLDQSMAKSATRNPLGRLTPLLKTVALAVTMVGAIPTAITAYHAWQYKVPFSHVSHRLAQYEIWERNIECKIAYKALSTAEGTKVDAGVCPQTRDISLKVSDLDGKATYEWIAYNQLRRPGEQPTTTNLLDWLIGLGYAGEAQKPPRLAQAALEVVCQSLVSKHELVRIVKEDGKCFRETTSPVRGTIDKREPVSCDAKCPSGS